MAIDIEEFKGENSSWYTFPDGTKLQGAEKAQAYADELAEFDAIADEEAAAEAEAEEAEKRERMAAEAEESDGDNVVKSSDTKPEPLVAGKPDAKPKPVVDAAEETDVQTDNSNTPFERDAYLMEMTRQNRMFEYAGKNKNYVFRHNARILVVDAEDVQGLRNEGGFRVVTPDEARTYYS